MPARIITDYEWNFGDGSLSYEGPTTTHHYTTGWYTVELKIILEDGTESWITKEYYIKVRPKSQSNLNEGYIRDHCSVHYGEDVESGIGWSENTGDSWIWPESKASIVDFSFRGKRFKLMWDMYSDKQYVVNTENLLGQYILKDRMKYDITTMDVDPNSGTQIHSNIILPEFNGDMQKYYLTHLSTDLYFRSFTNDYDMQNDFEVVTSLIDNEQSMVVDIDYDTDRDGDIVFHYQTVNTKNTTTRQIGIETNIADFSFLGYDSLFRVIDANRNAFTGDKNKTIASSMVGWYTDDQSQHRLDRYSKVLSEYGNEPIPFDPIEGKNGVSILTPFYFKYEPTDYYWVSFWTKNSDGDAIANAGTAFTFGDPKDGWQCYIVKVGGSPFNYFKPGYTIFDVRLYKENDFPGYTMRDYVTHPERYIPLI